jgi:hypothetical protein
VKYRNYGVNVIDSGYWYTPYSAYAGLQPKQGFIDAGESVWSAGRLKERYHLDVMYEHAKRKWTNNGLAFEVVGNKAFKAEMFSRAMRDGISLKDPEYRQFVQANAHHRLDRMLSKSSVSIGVA